MSWYASGGPLTMKQAMAQISDSRASHPSPTLAGTSMMQALPSSKEQAASAWRLNGRADGAGSLTIPPFNTMMPDGVRFHPIYHALV